MCALTDRSRAPVGLLSALLLLGCGDESSSNDLSADPSMMDPEAAATCELPSGGYTEDCNSCLAAACCDAITACKMDATCSVELGCVVDCQDAEDPGVCSMACRSGSTDPYYATYLGCSFERCLTTCWM